VFHWLFFSSSFFNLFSSHHILVRKQFFYKQLILIPIP
jgi:hypothetical protein